MRVRPYVVEVMVIPEGHDLDSRLEHFASFLTTIVRENRHKPLYFNYVYSNRHKLRGFVVTNEPLGTSTEAKDIFNEYLDYWLDEDSGF